MTAFTPLHPPSMPRFSGIKIDEASFKARLKPATAQIYLEAYTQAARDLAPLLPDDQKQVDLWVRLTDAPLQKNGVNSKYSIQCQLMSGDGQEGDKAKSLRERLSSETLPQHLLSEPPHQILSQALARLTQLMLFLVGDAFTGRLIELETEVDTLKQQAAQGGGVQNAPAKPVAGPLTHFPFSPVLTTPVTPLTQEATAKTQVETFRLGLAKLKQEVGDQEKQQKAWSEKTTAMAAAMAAEKLVAPAKAQDKIRAQAETLAKGVEAALRKKTTMATTLLTFNTTYRKVLPSALTYCSAMERESIQLEAEDTMANLENRLTQLNVDLEFLRGRVAALRFL